MTYMIGEEIWRIWGRNRRFVRERERGVRPRRLQRRIEKNEEEEEGSAYVLKINWWTDFVGIRSVLF